MATDSVGKLYKEPSETIRQTIKAEYRESTEILTELLTLPEF